MSERSRRDLAISIIKEMQETHVLWRDFLEEHPEWVTREVGDIDHHKQCIRDYDIVLEELSG